MTITPDEIRAIFVNRLLDCAGLDATLYAQDAADTLRCLASIVAADDREALRVLAEEARGVTAGRAMAAPTGVRLAVETRPRTPAAQGTFVPLRLPRFLERLREPRVRTLIVLVAVLLLAALGVVSRLAGPPQTGRTSPFAIPEASSPSPGPSGDEPRGPTP